MIPTNYRATKILPIYRTEFFLCFFYISQYYCSLTDQKGGFHSLKTLTHYKVIEYLTFLHINRVYIFFVNQIGLLC